MYVSMPHYYLPLPKVSSRVYKKAYKKHYKSYVRKLYLNYLFYAVRIEALTYEGT